MKNRAQLIFVILVLHLAGGIMLAQHFPFYRLQTWSLFLIAGLTTLLAFLLAVYLRYNLHRRKVLISGLLYLLLLTLGFWITLRSNEALQPGYFAASPSDYLRLLVVEEPRKSGAFLRVKARVQGAYHQKTYQPYLGHLLLHVKRTKSQALSIAYGDELLVPAHYSPVPPPENEGEFDYAAWLASKNMRMQLYTSDKELMVIGHHRGSPVLDMALRLRKKQVDLLNKLMADPEARAVAATLILGYRSELDKETLTAYAKTGTIHVLSVSGMHVGIIYLMLHHALRFMDRHRRARLAKALLIIFLIWGYALLTGCAPSVLRSALMLSCFILASATGRRGNSYNILAFSAFVLLLQEPLLLYDLGFQLSYAAVWGLLYLQPLIYQKIQIKNRIGNQLWQYLSLSLAAQLATFPLSVYYFHQFPVYFLVSNLAVMLPAALIMYLGFAILLCRFVFLAPALEYLLTFTNGMLRWMAELPGATISGIWLNKPTLLLLCLMLALGVSCLQKFSKQRLYLLLVVILSYQTVAAWRQLQWHQQRKVIHFRLRKHYARAYLHGQQAILLTDLTPESAAFQYSVKPCLEKNGIRTIEFKNATGN